MGRYYYGDIEGKFWFGVQCTDCMESYGAYFQGNECVFGSCSCYVNGEDDGTDFCHDCFDSLEEHLKAIEEYDGVPVTSTIVETECAKYIIHRDIFEENGKPFINEHSELFMKCVKTFEIDKECHYDYVIVFNETIKEASILADLCMLKQIEKFFEDNPDRESCSWKGDC